MDCALPACAEKYSRAAPVQKQWRARLALPGPRIAANGVSFLQPSVMSPINASDRLSRDSEYNLSARLWLPGARLRWLARYPDDTCDTPVLSLHDREMRCGCCRQTSR